MIIFYNFEDGRQAVGVKEDNFLRLKLTSTNYLKPMDKPHEDEFLRWLIGGKTGKEINLYFFKDNKTIAIALLGHDGLYYLMAKNLPDLRLPMDGAHEDEFLRWVKKERNIFAYMVEKIELLKNKKFLKNFNRNHTIKEINQLIEKLENGEYKFYIENENSKYYNIWVERQDFLSIKEII